MFSLLCQELFIYACTPQCLCLVRSCWYKNRHWEEGLRPTNCVIVSVIVTVTTCSCICNNFTFTLPRNCFLMHPFWIPFSFCPYLPLCTHPQEVIMQVALPCVESAISSSFPSSHENWISLGPVTDFPKIPFSCCTQNAAAERLLIVWVNLTVKMDATLIIYFSFPVSHGSIWLPLPILTLPPRFSLFTSHTVSPLPTSSLLNVGLFWLFLTSFWSLLKARISVMFPPASSSVHSKYSLKEYPSSKHFLVGKVDTKAADGPERAFILNKSWKTAWYMYIYSSRASPAGRLNNGSICFGVFLFQICIQEAHRVQNSFWGKCDPSLLCSPETYEDNLCNKFYSSSFTGLTTCILNIDDWISSLHFFLKWEEKRD